MNNGHSNKNSKGNGSNSSKPKEEKGAEQPYLSNPSRDYSSDPSKYAYPPKNGNQKPKENYTTDI